MERLSSDFKKKQCKDITTSNFVAALLEEKDKHTAMEELNELEQMIQEQRERLLKNE